MTSFVKGGEPLLTQPMYASRTPKIIHQGNFIVAKDSPQNYVLNAKKYIGSYFGYLFYKSLTLDMGSPDKDFNYFDLPQTPHLLQAHTE